MTGAQLQDDCRNLDKLERAWIFALYFLMLVASVGFAGHALT